MKVCCESGKVIIELSELEKLSCNHDHCKGPIELGDYLLETCGTFHTNECTSSDDLAKLLDKPNWKEWITSQIEQKGIEKYKDWYARMLQRGAICDELVEANNKLFGEKE